MKINKLYISAFGGLKDFTLELGDGLNVIYGNNEGGKSTVSAFIKAMFFGTGKKTQSLANSVRQKYTPWDGSTMAGRIFFEHGGKNYCLEREFRKSDSTDRILLTNTDSGKQLDTADSIGQQFFGLSAAAFERSLFIGAGGDFAADSASAGEINAKLSNIAVTGNEDTSYQKIAKNINDAKNRVISKSGRVGLYAEDMQLLEELKARLASSERDAQKTAELNREILSYQSEYEALYKKYTELKTVVDSENDLKNREKLIEYLDTKSKLDAQTKALTLSDGTVADKAFVDKVHFVLNRYEKSADRINELNLDIENINNSIALLSQSSPESAKQQIDKLCQKNEELSVKKNVLLKKEDEYQAYLSQKNSELEHISNKKQAVNPLFLILAIVFSLATAATTVASSLTGISIIPTVVSAFCAIVFWILSFTIRPKNKRLITALQNEAAKISAELNIAKSDRNLLQEEINNINAQINNLSAVLNADSAVKAERQNDLAAKKQALAEEQQKLQSAFDEVMSFVSRFTNAETIKQVADGLAVIEEKTEAQKQLKLRLSYLSKDLGNISYDEAERKLEKINSSTPDSSVDFEGTKAIYEATRERLSEIKTRITENVTELKTAFKNSENPEDIKREINTCKERLAREREFCDTAQIALEVLEESFYEVRKGYGSELEKKTLSIFKDLTGGKYNRVTVSDTLEMSVEQSSSFGTHELGFLSLGTTHQAYLSLRLAIASLISKDEALPIFLDDSLSQYDDRRLNSAIKFLSEYCQNGQGILFTCHNTVCDIAASQNITVQRPYK